MYLCRHNPIYLALDTDSYTQSERFLNELDGLVGGIKIGLEFWCKFGPEKAKHIVGTNDWFLDLKLHDIPATVGKAISAVLQLEPNFISIHESGGTEMMCAAVEAADYAPTLGLRRPNILAVTTLTSINRPVDYILAQAQNALACKVDGLISSPLEIAALRGRFGNSFISMVPGIRPSDAEINDQIRISTPKLAIENGADYLVIGRPITKSSNPALVCRQILKSLA